MCTGYTGDCKMTRYDVLLKYSEQELNQNRTNVLSSSFCTVYGKVGSDGRSQGEIIVAQNFGNPDFTIYPSLRIALNQSRDYVGIRKTFRGTSNELIQVAYEGIPLHHEKPGEAQPVRDERIPLALRNITITSREMDEFEQFLLYIQKEVGKK